MQTETVSSHFAASFEELNLAPQILEAIKAMGFQHPTEVQARTIPLALEGKDLVVQSRTGTGKTAAFGLPIIQRLLVNSSQQAQALVLTPTRELALQVAEECRRLAVKTTLDIVPIYGGAAIAPQINALKKRGIIVVGTPGRVLDHLRRKTLDSSSIKALVLDEGDEMLSMGFYEEITSILEKLPEERQSMLFSATVPDDIQRLVEKHFNQPERLLLSEDFVGVLEIDHVYYLVSGGDRLHDLIRILDYESPDTALIFCNTRDDTALVTDFLKAQQYKAEGISGDLTQRERERVMMRMRQNELKFLVATDVAARGIDLSDLSHVINYSFPESADVYIHRTGRTGRAGKSGTAISLVSPREIGSFYYLKLIHKIYPQERYLPSSEELATRREAERFEQLTQRFADYPAPSEEMRSLARRVWSTVDGERIFALAFAELLREEAAPISSSEHSVDWQDVPHQRYQQRSIHKNKGRKTTPARNSRSRSSRPERPPQECDRANESTIRQGEKTGEFKRRKITRTRSKQDNEKHGAFTMPDGEIEFWETVEQPNDRTDADARLFFNIGRRHNLRASDLRQLIQQHSGANKDEILRIQVRDNFSFVSIPVSIAELIIEKLTGASFNGKEIRVEHAKH